MSVQVQPNTIDIEKAVTPQDVEAPQPAASNQDQGFGATGERFLPLDGVGNLLFQMHSSFITAFCEQVKTSLQFYDHVGVQVVATVSRKLWCFPKRTEAFFIPRFKIVDCTFFLGPKFPLIFWLILLLSIIFILIGAARGGCKAKIGYNYDYDYSYSSSFYESYSYIDSGACAWLVIGCLVLVFCVILAVAYYWFVKIHHVHIETKVARTLFARSGVRSYDFRFKEIGFELTTDNTSAFDQFYLFDYICKPFSKQSADDMHEYHLFSHFNNADLADHMEMECPVHEHNHCVHGNVIHRKIGRKRGSESHSTPQ